MEVIYCPDCGTQMDWVDDDILDTPEPDDWDADILCYGYSRYECPNCHAEHDEPVYEDDLAPE